ncbi:MAG: M48 family metalloprotease [Methanomassiliicoccus sp.]|nr:M48 family metalloprotease [Methanomassiliicoccus sp.]
MGLAEQIVLQLMQPTFYYATVLMFVALASSILLIRINRTMGPRWRSVMMVLPLVLALAVLLIYPPTLFAPGASNPVPPTDLLPPLDGHAWDGTDAISTPGADDPTSVLQIGPLLIIAGLALGGLSLALSLLFSQLIVRRMLRVVDLEPADHPGLHEDVAKIAARLGMPAPRLGLVEDLRPNAFTFGWGKNSTVVFSLGILSLLDRGELRAVAAHELAHIRNRDLWFRAGSRALAWVFFFNPAAHLSIRAAQREREQLADETARSVLGERKSLIRAIEKVTGAGTKDAPRSTLASRLGLRMTLSLTERSSLISDHPAVADRKRSIDGRTAPGPGPRACVVLSIGVVLAASLLMVSMGEARADILSYLMTPPISPLPSVQDVGPQLTGFEMHWSSASGTPSQSGTYMSTDVQLKYYAAEGYYNATSVPSNIIISS